MKLPVLSGREVIKTLKKIDKGTLLEIIRQSGLKREEFLKLL